MKVPKPRKLSSGVWFIQLRLGGVSVPVTAETKTQCIQAAELIKAEYRNGKRAIVNSELTLKEACEKYIARKEKQGKSPETIRGYDVILNNRFQSAMNRKVKSIKNWQELYDADFSNLSAKTMQNTWSFIKSACKTECGITLPEIEKAAPKRTEHLFLEPEQVKVFASAAKTHKYAIAMLLHLSSCRASEVRGLTWDKVDLKNQRIHIKGAKVRDKNNKLVDKKENKTEGSERYIPIFIPELEETLKAVPEEKRVGNVVTARANTVYNAINKLCQENGLPEVGTHGLRHSFASLCYSLNVPIKITMQVGGWDDYNTVMRVYTHLAKQDVGKYTDDLNTFFAPKKSQTS